MARVCGACLLAARNYREALRQALRLVAVGHPHALPPAGAAVVAIQLARGGGDLHPAVLPLRRGLHNAAQRVHKQLEAVADAEHGHRGGGGPVKEAGGHGGAAGRVHTVGAARQDDHRRAGGLDARLRAGAGTGGKGASCASAGRGGNADAPRLRHVAGQHQRVHTQLAHAAAYQLRVLAAGRLSERVWAARGTKRRGRACQSPAPARRCPCWAQARPSEGNHGTAGRERWRADQRCDGWRNHHISALDVAAARRTQVLAA